MLHGLAALALWCNPAFQFRFLAPVAKAFPKLKIIHVKLFCICHVFGVCKRQPSAVVRLYHVGIYQRTNPGKRVSDAPCFLWPVFDVLILQHFTSPGIKIVVFVQFLAGTTTVAILCKRCYLSDISHSGYFGLCILRELDRRSSLSYFAILSPHFLSMYTHNQVNRARGWWVAPNFVLGAPPHPLTPLYGLYSRAWVFSLLHHFHSVLHRFSHLWKHSHSIISLHLLGKCCADVSWLSK